MKLLLIFSGEFECSYGGGQVYVKNLLSGFYAYSDLNLLFLYLNANSSESRNETIVYEGFQGKQISGNKNEIANAVCGILEDFKPDVIHAHGEKMFTLELARKYHIPCVITAHHGGIICPAGTMMNCADKICTVPVSDRNCLKCVLRNIPGSFFWYLMLKCIPLSMRMRLAEFFGKRRFILFLTPVFTATAMIRNKLRTIDSLKLADRILSPCEKMKELFEINGIQGNVELLPHGIPHIPKQTFPSIDGKIRFYYIGRICYVKGLHVMLDAFRGIPKDQYELHIIGEGCRKQEIRYWNTLKKRGRDLNLVWHGKVSHDRVEKLIGTFHVMIHPAICLEIFGLNIAESLACGRPVLASLCGGSEMQITDGFNGWLVPPNNSDALRRKIKGMIDNPGELVRIAGNCGIPDFKDHIFKLETVYRNVKNEKSRH